jgi:hypothetical protein
MKDFRSKSESTGWFRRIAALRYEASHKQQKSASLLALFSSGPAVSAGCLNPRARASSPEYAEQQRCQEDHDKDEEQDLRDFGCATRDTAEAEKRRDDRDDEKDDSVSKHEALHRGRLSDWFACWLEAPPPCLSELRRYAKRVLRRPNLEQPPCPRRWISVNRAQNIHLQKSRTALRECGLE